MGLEKHGRSIVTENTPSRVRWSYFPNSDKELEVKSLQGRKAWSKMKGDESNTYFAICPTGILVERKKAQSRRLGLEWAGDKLQESALNTNDINR